MVRGASGDNLKGKRIRKLCVVIPGDGDPCPRCGEPMQIREYAFKEKQERRASFYTRWFCCMNETCKTTLVMPARYKMA